MGQSGITERISVLIAFTGRCTQATTGAQPAPVDSYEKRGGGQQTSKLSGIEPRESWAIHLLFHQCLKDCIRCIFIKLDAYPCPEIVGQVIQLSTR